MRERGRGEEKGDEERESGRGEGKGTKRGKGYEPDITGTWWVG